MNKLNLGCGADYRKGWVNVDFNKETKADGYFDLEKFPYPIERNSIDEILMDNVLEHISPNKIIKVMEELWKICKPNGKIRIHTPHCSGMYAFSHLTHYSFFGIGKFDSFRKEKEFNDERYSKVRFKVKEKLLFFHHNLQDLKAFYYISKNMIDWMFNFGRTWQQLMERFQFLGFDEIRYDLEVVK